MNNEETFLNCGISDDCNFTLWMRSDIASIYMWVIPALDQPGAWSMVAMWTVITGNALYGAYMWFIIKINK